MSTTTGFRRLRQGQSLWALNVSLFLFGCLVLDPIPAKAIALGLIQCSIYDTSGCATSPAPPVPKPRSSGEPGTYNAPGPPSPSPAELKHIEEEKDLREAADDADDKGVECYEKGDWACAVRYFKEALEYEPDDADIRHNLQRAEERQRTANAVTIPPPNPTPTPYLHTVPNLIVNLSPPAQVLNKRGPDIENVKKKIKQAQEALRRLIHSNQQDEELRLEWTAESLEATGEAEKLSLNLVIDLIGAHVDHLAAINKQERAQVLNGLLNRAEGEAGASLHNHYGMLVDRKDELERIQQEVRLASKLNDLRQKIRDLKKADNSKFTRQDFWDVISQFKKVEDFAGPSKDLMDSAYVIYQQATSCRRLSAIQKDQERNLLAAAKLQRYIVRLESEKRDLEAGCYESKLCKYNQSTLRRAGTHLFNQKMAFQATSLRFYSTVGDFVAVKASKNQKVQQPSMGSSQQVQHQSLGINRFQQSSTRLCTWFGTRGSTRSTRWQTF